MGATSYSHALAVQEALRRGIGWLLENLREFSIADRINLSNANLKDNVALLKPISELGLTLWLLERCGVPREVNAPIARWIWEQSGSGKVLTHLLLARHDFLPCCSLYASLYQLGYRADHLEEAISFLAETDLARALPLPPWGALALDYNLSLLPLGTRPAVRRNALYTSALPEPWVVSGEIAYAITHEVFYLTDFGFCGIADKEVADYLRLWTPYWGQVFVEQKDYDLAGEYAMVWRCLGLPSAVSIAGKADPLIAVMQAQDESGYLEGPEGAGTILYRQDDTADRRTFLGRYHTTLVALMACALELRAIIEGGLSEDSEIRVEV